MKGLESFSAIKPSARSAFEGQNQEQKGILSVYSDAEQKEIVSKQKLLSTLGYFIGKDFEMPILLNEPGKGWHWNFAENYIKIDPKDLLEKPLDYLRFVISHEGGHRRISRTDFIPEEVWREPGFSYMMNAIEDPRDNNFVAEAYPKFREQMSLAYSMDIDRAEKAREISKDKIGTVPRFVQAGQEYIRQWFNEVQDKPFTIDPTLLPEVQDVIRETLVSAQDSWWRYPTKEEADASEVLISKYAEASYRINLKKIWPSFKTLVDADKKDEQTRQAMEDMKSESNMSQDSGTDTAGERQDSKIPDQLNEKLTPEEQQELEDALDSDDGEMQSNTVSPAELSPGLKSKIEAYVESLPDDKKRELAKRAEDMLRELEEEINKALEGKMSEPTSSSAEEREDGDVESVWSTETSTDVEDMEPLREKLQEILEFDRNQYELVRKEVLPIIDRLEDDLRELFVARRARAWKSGYTSGKRIDIKHRIQEKAKGVSAVESRAWEKRDAPAEKDYAFTLLVDLSGSMDGEKIEETFKAVVVLCEVLNKLSIKIEILGFNDKLHHFQNFNDTLSNDIRDSMGSMLEEVGSPGAAYNDDGWALSEASARLSKQVEDVKFLIVLSDGQPVPSSWHSALKYDLGRVIKNICSESNQKLIGLGIGPNTQHVSQYYPNSLANVGLSEMAEQLAGLLKEAIENYQDF